MSQPARSHPKPIAELVAPTLEPVLRKRGLARAEMISWWPDIVGETYARLTAPERIRWPRHGGPATLILRCDPSVALQLSYETDLLRQRLNGFFGYPAVGRIRIVQHPISRPPPTAHRPAGLGEAEERRLADRLAGLDEPLRQAFAELGRAVLARP